MYCKRFKSRGCELFINNRIYKKKAINCYCSSIMITIVRIGLLDRCVSVVVQICSMKAIFYHWYKKSIDKAWCCIFLNNQKKE